MSWIRNLSIKNKILLVILTVTYGTILLWFLLVVFHYSQKTKTAFQRSMEMTTKIVADYSVAPITFNDTIELANILSKASNIPSVVGLAVYEQNTLLTYFVNTDRNISVVFPYKFEPDRFLPHDQLKLFLTPITFRNTTYGLLALYAETGSVRTEIKEYIFQLLISLIILALLAALAALKIQKVISEPILNLANILHYVAESNDYSTRVERKMNDEISDLYKAFNNLLHQIEIRDKTRDEIEKKLEAAKNKAEEADRLKTAFLTNMSHELRTPMNAILGFSALLPEPNITEEQRKQFVDIIIQSGNTLLTLVEDILDISKIEAGQLSIHLEPVHIGRVLDELYLSFLEIKNQRKINNVELLLDNSLDTSSLVLITDNHRFRQIFMNLISNALKFTDQGYVRFGVASISDGMITFFVNDTGIGMTPEQIPNIFDRFTKIDTEKNRLFRGAGLGLAICKKLLELLHGNIWVESELGKGSTFYFSVPDNRTTLSTPAPQPYNYKYSIPTPDVSLEVLIAEDDEYNTQYLLQILSKHNVKTTVVADGAQAVQMCENRVFDVVLMDIKMPTMNGYEATQKIKQINPRQRIIIQTAYAGAQEIEEAIAAGCDDFITKPINANLLLKKIFTKPNPST